MKIHLTIHGQGRPLVLFHGWGFDHHIWHALLPAFVEKYQVYLVDLPGFGLSSHLCWDDFKYNLLTQLPAEFALAGWSMGGLYATRLAIDAPTRVTHLLNIASSPRFIQDEHWPGVAPSVFSAFHDDLVKNPMGMLKQFVHLQLQSTCMPITLGETPTLIGLRCGLDTLINWDLRESLHQLKQPVCYLFGRLDNITPRKLMIAMQARYPNFEYRLFQQSAHAPFLSHTDAFMTLLDEFLR